MQPWNGERDDRVTAKPRLFIQYLNENILLTLGNRTPSRINRQACIYEQVAEQHGVKMYVSPKMQGWVLRKMLSGMEMVMFVNMIVYFYSRVRKMSSANIFSTLHLQAVYYITFVNTSVCIFRPTHTPASQCDVIIMSNMKSHSNRTWRVKIKLINNVSIFLSKKTSDVGWGDTPK